MFSWGVWSCLEWRVTVVCLTAKCPIWIAAKQKENFVAHFWGQFFQEETFNYNASKQFGKISFTHPDTVHIVCLATEFDWLLALQWNKFSHWWHAKILHNDRAQLDKEIRLQNEIFSAACLKTHEYILLRGIFYECSSDARVMTCKNTGYKAVSWVGNGYIQARAV